MREYLEQLLIVLAIGSGVAILAKRVNAPYNVALVIVGLLLVLMDVLPRTTMDPNVVLLLFLPILVFQGALTADDVSMKRAARPILALALPGVAISLVYRDGVFEVGVTRGDGKKGDDVTHNLRTVGGLPLRLNTKSPPAHFEARGEIYMTKADFARLNAEISDAGEKYANPRNLTAGSLKQLDPRICATRRLRAPVSVTVAWLGDEERTRSRRPVVITDEQLRPFR